MEMVQTDIEHSLPGNLSPQKPRRRARISDATETIQIGMATSYDNTMDSNEYTDLREEQPRFRRIKSRDTTREEARHQGRSALRHDRLPAEPFASRAKSSRSRSPAKRSRSPEKVPPIPRSSTADLNLAARRNHQGVSPLDLDAHAVRQYASSFKKAVQIQIPPRHQSHRATVVSPSTPPRRHRAAPREDYQVREDSIDESSSYYSEDDYDQAPSSYISPLRIRKTSNDDNNALLFRIHEDRDASPARRIQRNASPPERSPLRRAIKKTATVADLGPDEPSPRDNRNYSPLSDYLVKHSKPVRKEMVGAKGWLERTTKTSNKKDDDEKKKDGPSTQKKPGFLQSLIKLAKDVTSSVQDITGSASRKGKEKGQKPSSLTVSTDPREQSLLYCELEYLLATALQSYIQSQFSAGRLDADKYKRIVDGWQQRGRPKVVGYRYDIETQLDLIMLHAEDFRFYGKRAGNLAAVNGVLDMMRVNARALRIRTFCQPDTVIAKQLLDSQSLFNLIGCYESQQIQLAEVIQFFKVIIERERNFRRMEMEAEQQHEGADYAHHQPQEMVQEDMRGGQPLYSSSLETETHQYRSTGKMPQSSKDSSNRGYY